MQVGYDLSATCSIHVQLAVSNYAFPLFPLPSESDLDDPEEFKVAKFYFWFGLKCVVGHAGWTNGIKLYTTISRAKTTWNNTMPLAHPTSESFFLLMWENYHKRFTAQLEYCKQNKVLKVPDRTKPTKDLDIHHSLYTSQDGGQCKFGGWSAQGITRFNAIYTQLTTAKYVDPTNILTSEIKPEWHAWEQKLLDKMRAEWGIVAATPEAQRRNRAGIAAPQVAVPPPAPLGGGFI